ncbi:Lysophospholipase 1 [Orbilia oligospora]|uniref:Lysophospholipase n=1 Tax=Orbilia oligospora TaxID=2813651 RepID=A0A7C8NZX0_ORBOL|nr:Lysophospholipase 1 [Orbilia oligospora]
MGGQNLVGFLLHLCLLSTGYAAASAIDVDSARAELYSLEKRVVPDAPNGYAPGAVNCPSTRPSIRSASELSSEEVSWLNKRRNNTIQPLRDFLTRVNIPGFDAGAYIDANRNNARRIPNIGIAMSGGGYRALMNGAGALAAFDSRTNNSTSAGHLGGLLQSSTYLAGLSGGGWLVGSLSLNNFTSVEAIVNSNPDEIGSLWQFQNSIFAGPEKSEVQTLSGRKYYENIIDAVNSKRDAGFNTSITDLWGRALSFQLINSPEGGPGITWSGISDDPDFTAANVAMPIVVADGRAPGEIIISLNTTVFEFNPFEMGSWDPTVFGFAPIRYVGSNFSQGVVVRNEQCIRGFDNAGFVMGTSSSLFNQFLLNFEGVASAIPSIFRGLIEGILNSLSQDENDIADWTPNPFYRWNPQTNPSAESKRLTLVDGGEDLQNLPLQPLIQPEREVDVVFAVDSSADTLAPGANWPNGTALVATYARSISGKLNNGTGFPAIPDQNTFVNLGLNTRPTFFGCDASNFTDVVPPLLVYIPNHPFIYNSNVSTFTMSYNISERNAIIQNGYLVATRGNSTLDANWPQCVGCAIMSRTWARNSATVPDVCSQCFNRYCWNGTRASQEPAEPYEPTPVFSEVSLATSNKKNSAMALAPSFMSLTVVVGSIFMIAF